MPETSAPSTTSPSLVARRSRTTKSPSAAARSTSLRVANRSRSASTCVGDLGGQAGVVGDGDLGLDVDLGGEGEALVVGHLEALDLGLGQRREVVGLERLGVHGGEGLVDGLLEDGAAPDLTVDDRRRDLAAAEAGHVDLLGDLLVGSVQVGLEILERHLDGELDPRGAQGLDGALHRWSPSCFGIRSGRIGVGRVAVGATGLEPAISCSQSRRASHYATPRQVDPQGAGRRCGTRLERMTGIEPA
jgi:hypothetical protein